MLLGIEDDHYRDGNDRDDRDGDQEFDQGETLVLWFRGRRSGVEYRKHVGRVNW